MEVTHGISMVNSYGQKPMENSWIIPHDFSIGHFCKGSRPFLGSFRDIFSPDDVTIILTPKRTSLHETRRLSHKA